MTVLKNITLAPMRVLGQPKSYAEAGAIALLERIGLVDKKRRVSRPALGRPAAARRDRAGARDAAAGAAARRDHQRARSRARRRGAQHRARPQGGRAHDGARDPRDGLRPRGREPRLLPRRRRRARRRARPSRSSANPRHRACRASFAASSRPAASNSLAGLRKLRPARLAALGNRFFAHPAAHCAATQLRAGRGPSPIPGNGSGSMRARPHDASPPRDRPPQHAEPNGLHLRARHVRAPRGPGLGLPVRRARSGASPRRHRRARVQA